MKLRLGTCALIAAVSIVPLTGCQVVRGEQTVAEYSTDSKVTANVKMKLAQSDQVSVSRVHVETDNGVVLLSGFAKDQHQRRIAGKIAQSVKGVKSVKNNIVINN